MCQKHLYKILLEVSSEENQSIQLISFIVFFLQEKNYTYLLNLIGLSQEQKPLRALDSKLSTVYSSIMLMQLQRKYCRY